MFEFEKESYEVNDEWDEVYYKLTYSKIFGVFSPFEVDTSVEFPNKDKLGGVVLKFVGGGASYFKIQKTMPSKEDVDSILEICEFLKDNFGEYTVAFILCEPHIEIRDIDIPDKNFEVHFVSSRKNDGDFTLNGLIDKLEHNIEFSISDHVLKIMLPFMSRKDDAKFQSRYSKFVKLFDESNMRIPDGEDINKPNGMFINKIF